MASLHILLITVAMSLLSSAVAQSFQVTFYTQEEEPLWTYIGNVSDAEGFIDAVPPEDRQMLLFSFLQQTTYKSLLRIHGETGALYNSVFIDRDSITECQIPGPCKLVFNIAARSQRKDSPFFEIIAVTVVIEDKNDNAPSFPLDTQVINISEAAVNSTATLIESANDADAGTNSIQYYELVGNRDLFTLDVERKLDGSLSVRLLVIGKLNRELKDFYQCAVIARDGGQPPKNGTMKLNITILDENDNAPVFSKTSYNVTVEEDIRHGTTVAVVTASDDDIGQNAQLLYRFSPHQPNLDHLNTLFYINEGTGEFSVIGKLVYQPGQVYQVIIEATDQGSPPLLSTNQAIVTVNVKDTGNNPPVVTVNLLSTGNGSVKNVSEISGKGTFVAHVEVQDTDTGANGNVTCDIEDNLFEIEKLSEDSFKVIVDGVLDRERQDIHTVIITCHDFGSPVLSSSASFYVRVTDENDNPPKFTQSNYIEDLYENNEKDDTVLSVFARDADLGNNSKIEYSLDSSVRNYFAIERVSGIIRARTRFDRENQTSWTFNIYATDLGEPPLTGTATVTVRIQDVNDNAPKFDNSTFYFKVRENLVSGTVVDRITAFDPDSGRNGKFDFAVSDYRGDKLPFSLYPRDGVITTTMELNREDTSHYEFTVVAVDQGSPRLTSSAKVVVSVTDDNDFSPRIIFPKPDNDTVTIAHLKQAGTYVTHIEAYDDDIGDNGKLSYIIEEGNEARLFQLNLNTGVLTMAGLHEVAEDKDETYNLVIAVHDGGVPQRSERCELNVIVKYSNETMSVAEPVGSGSNTNIVIVVVVIIFTFCLSVAIIVVICVIRRFDRNRLKGQTIQITKLPNNMTEVRDSTNGGVISRPYDHIDTLRKKKEVSFSFEDDLDGFREHEISFCNNSVFMDNTEVRYFISFRNSKRHILVKREIL